MTLVAIKSVKIFTKLMNTCVKAILRWLGKKQWSYKILTLDNKSLYLSLDPVYRLSSSSHRLMPAESLLCNKVCSPIRTLIVIIKTLCPPVEIQRPHQD